MYTEAKFRKQMLNDTHKSWGNILRGEVNKKYFQNLIDIVLGAYNSAENLVSPRFENMFNAFDMDVNKIAVIILTKDPPPDKNSSSGLDIDISSNVMSKEIKDMYSELYEEFDVNNYSTKDHSSLASLKGEGVLFLNCCLTKFGDNHERCWSEFTTNILKELDKIVKNVVYITWNSYSMTLLNKVMNGDEEHTGKKKSEKERRQMVENIVLLGGTTYKPKLEGSNIFLYANHYLKEWYKPTIKWI